MGSIAQSVLEHLYLVRGERLTNFRHMKMHRFAYESNETVISIYHFEMI